MNRRTDKLERPKHVRGPRRSGRWPAAVASLFACFLIASAVAHRIPWLVVGAYLVMRLATFCIYGWDKLSARHGAWRTPEATLHLLGLAGGWPGGLAAQQWLRHKSSKREFLLVFWLTVALNVAVIGWVVWSGAIQPSSINDP